MKLEILNIHEILPMEKYHVYILTILL